MTQPLKMQRENANRDTAVNYKFRYSLITYFPAARY